jgi:MFS family permease
MRFQLAGLWKHPDFIKLWFGQTISLLGTQVTNLALPLTAILVLNASAGEIGILQAARSLPFLFLALPAGVWIDRLRRRPLLIRADLARAVLLGSIPAAALLGLLRIEQLYLVSFLGAILTLFFDLSYMSFLPTLVEREQLVEGNSKLQISYSFASIAGPGLAGALVQIVTAPIAIIVDALSFLVSALFIRAVARPEPDPKVASERRELRSELQEGLQAVLGNPILRAFAGATAMFNLFISVWLAVQLLYMTRELRIDPAILGLIFAIGGPGSLLGAVSARAITTRFGLGPTIVGSAPLSLLAPLLVPLASGPAWLIILVLGLAQFLMSFGSTIYNINLLSLRQAITPNRMQGRVNATMRFIAWGVTPVGALLGGMLGESIGLRPTLFVGAIGVLLALPWILFSPIPHTRTGRAEVESQLN